MNSTVMVIVAKIFMAAACFVELPISRPQGTRRAVHEETEMRYGLVVVLVCAVGGGCDAPKESVPNGIGSIQSPAFGSGSTDLGAYYRLKSVSSGFCVDVGNKSQSNGATVLQWDCSTGENQRWYLRALTNGNYQVQARHSAKCLRVSGGSTSAGAGFVQDPCARTGTGTNGTIFTLTRVGTTGSNYQLKVVNGGQCLQSPSTTKGAQLKQAACGTSSKFLWTLEKQAFVSQSDANGRWSPVIDMKGVVPISAALRPDGKVLTWASWKGLRFGGSGSLDQTVTALFDPANPSNVVVRTITDTVHNMFCPATAFLPDGRLVVNGGDDVRTDATSIYDPIADKWTRGAAMHQQRWYNSSVSLPDGRILTLGGNRTSGASGNGEIYDATSDSWTMMDGIVLAPLTDGMPADARAMEHPRLSVAPDGRIFASGPSPNMQWYTTDGTGGVMPAGKRGDDEISQNDVTVMFDVGKILKAAGNVNYDRTDASFVPASRNSYVIDINGATPVVTKIAPIKYPRTFANGVVLPNGQVFVAGGNDNAKGFSDDGAIRPAELFDPTTTTWRELPAMATSRPYHSFVLLLADARVLVGGGGLCSSSDNCAVNHPNVEIYSPPYLFAGARPSIAAAPATVAADGGTFVVTTSGSVTGFSLIRVGSVTHGVDTDQRFMRLAGSNVGDLWTLQAPANHNLAPRGYYLLFALDGGVPSVAAIVKII
jgi:galactose oxidase